MIIHEQTRKRKILLICTTPFCDDGLTKIEMDIINFNRPYIDFEIASGFNYNNKYGDKLRKDHICCYSFASKRNVIKYAYSIWKLIKARSYDVIYIHGNSAMMSLEAFPAKLAGGHIITHCHNTKTNFPILHYLLKPFFNLIVDKKIGCSELASRWAYCGKNVLTISNGVDTKRFNYDEQKRQKMRNALGLEDKKIIGHIGRFSKQKNHRRLLDIFCEMTKQFSDLVLILIGTGELKNEIEQQIKQFGLDTKVHMIDYASNIEDYMRAMDLIIMPSLYEGLCLTALEGQACGTPVLVSDVFAAETYVTSNCHSLSLNQDNQVWADKALAMIQEERKDETFLFAEKKMDYFSMMKRIQSVLLGNKDISEDDL